MLARPFRLTRGDDYRRVVRSGARFAGKLVVVSATTSDDARPPRFGFIVSKTVGIAVVRNRTRRRLKAIAHELVSTVPDATDFVIRANPAAALADFAELKADVTNCVERALRPRQRQS